MVVELEVVIGPPARSEKIAPGWQNMRPAARDRVRTRKEEVVRLVRLWPWSISLVPEVEECYILIKASFKSNRLITAVPAKK